LLLLALSCLIFFGMGKLISERQGIVLGNGEILGGDFRVFYAAGRLAQEDRAKLYDYPSLQAVMETILTEEGAPVPKGKLPFVYPPLVVVPFMALANVSFDRAFFVFSGVGGVTALGAMWLLVSGLPIDRRVGWTLGVLLMAGFFPFALNTIFGGQLAWVGLSLVAGVAWLLMKNQRFWAGLFFSLSYYKPPLFLFLLLILLLTQGKRFFLGFSVGAGVLILATFLFVGGDGVWAFVEAGRAYSYGNAFDGTTQWDISHGAGWFTVLVQLFDSTLLPGTVSLVFRGVALWWLCRLDQGPEQKQPNFLSWYALAVICSLNFSPYRLVYDLSLLLPVFLMLGVLLWKESWRWPHWSQILLIALFYGEWLLRKQVWLGIAWNPSALLLPLLGFACLLGFRKNEGRTQI